MNQNESSTSYKVGDYVNIKVCEDSFRGRIVKFIYEGKNDTTPSKAVLEVCSTAKKVSGVTKSTMPVSLSSLSPLL